ncbi:hypothetical protein GGS21DRAFT_507388, partial [Xylaria nigripes]
MRSITNVILLPVPHKGSERTTLLIVCGRFLISLAQSNCTGCGKGVRHHEYRFTPIQVFTLCTYDTYYLGRNLPMLLFRTCC